MAERILETEQKALEINLDNNIYGTFAEIGAGQEVARHFFQAGAAAGTIAKTMSAYDKIVSDEIYGAEVKNRYVCEARLYKMLDHEYTLQHNRLRMVHPERKFFAFGDTVSAINYHKTNKGYGWLGLRFQLNPENEPNDLVLHCRLLDGDTQLQAQAIGILGVNMVYACYHMHQNPEQLLISLMDNLHGRLMIDMVRLSGPEFEDVDNRMLCLWSVKHKLSPVSIFNRKGIAVHASEFLYKKAVLIARGSYRPPTLVQQDMTVNGFPQFKRDAVEGERGAWYLTEITLSNLLAEGEINEQDYMDRVSLLNEMGQTVVISSCLKHKGLIQYFSEYKVTRIGLIMGSRKLHRILKDTFANNADNILGAFGELFMRDVRFYIYPAKIKGYDDLMVANNIPIPQGIRFLYEHLLAAGNVVDIENYNRNILHIYHKKVLKKIQSGESGWESDVPKEIEIAIKKNRLFGYRTEQIVES